MVLVDKYCFYVYRYNAMLYIAQINLLWRAEAEGVLPI